MMRYSDKELYNDVRLGGKKAFRILYERYWDKLYVYSFNIVKRQDFCEDIVQEIFIELWLKRNERMIDNMAAYLIKAAKFKSLNVIRNSSLSKMHLDLLNIDTPTNDTEQSVLINELTTSIDKAIASLPPKCREVFLLSRIEQLSNKEIAERLEISVQTVKNQISKALTILRDHL